MFKQNARDNYSVCQSFGLLLYCILSDRVRLLSVSHAIPRCARPADFIFAFWTPLHQLLVETNKPVQMQTLQRSYDVPRLNDKTK